MKIELSLNELLEVCECIEYCIDKRNHIIHPSNREKVKLISEKLRNLYEVGQDIKVEASN